MIELPLYNKTGELVDKISVDEKLFGGKVNLGTLREAIIMYEACQRQGTSSTKTRSEVSGSSRKPWAQKHTGRARSGTIRSPIWRHGGIVFGPKPRDYRYRLPKKMLRQALNSALLAKFQDKETYIIEGFNHQDKPRTKEIAALLEKIGLTRGCLIGIKEPNRILHLSVRNIPYAELLPVKDFNAYKIIKYKYLLLTKEALEYLITQRQVQSQVKEPV